MTTKYIEIDRAIETALLLLEEGEDEQTLAYNAALVAFIKNMENAPAADVVEVVRCKDCRYYQDNNDGYPHINCKWDANETPDADDFCSGAERRTDG